MNFFRKAIGYFAQRLSLTDPSGWRGSGGSSHAGESVTENSALALSAVWACANLLCGTISSLPLVVYRTNKLDDREKAKDHPLYRILHDSPNADQTAVDFLEYQTLGLEMRGNAYSRIDRALDGRIIALTPINPAQINVKRDRDGRLQYTWTEDGKSYIGSEENVFHVRGFGGSPLGGLSTLSYGRHAFGLAAAVDKAAGTTFKNGLRPSGILSFPSFLKKEQREIAEKDLVDKFSGAMNAGRPMILEGGLKWDQITISPEDAQMLQSRGFSVEEICRFFGVPPFMIGHTEKTTSWGTGLEQQILAFLKFTLHRRLKRIEKAIEKQLLTPQDRADGICVEFNLESLLRADSTARSAFYKDMSSIGAMTINEIRRKENEPPIEGGDVARIQMQNVPITETVSHVNVSPKKGK